jgi:hypothetical protein
MARRAGPWVVAALAAAASIPAYAQTRDPCPLLARNPGWSTALEAAQLEWRVSPGVILAVLDQESRFKPDARGAGAAGANPVRNFGFAQANLRTWTWFARETGETGGRTDFAASARFVGWHFATMERRIGRPRSDTVSQYLVYKQGEGGYRRGSPASARGVARLVAQRAAALEAALERCPTP